MAEVAGADPRVDARRRQEALRRERDPEARVAQERQAGASPRTATSPTCPVRAPSGVASLVPGLDLADFGRWALFNMWRSTTPPPQDHPLAVCDARTIRSDDGVPVVAVTEIRGSRRLRVRDHGLPLQPGAPLVLLPRHDAARGPGLQDPRQRPWPGPTGWRTPRSRIRPARRARRPGPAQVVWRVADYDRGKAIADLIAGVTVGLVALPLALAFAISSGLTPQAGIYTAVVAGGLISLLGGSRLQIGGPTGAFVVIVAGIVAKHGVEGLFVCTLMAGGMLIVLGATGMGQR